MNFCKGDLVIGLKTFRPYVVVAASDENGRVVIADIRHPKSSWSTRSVDLVLMTARDRKEYIEDEEHLLEETKTAIEVLRNGTIAV